MRDGVNQSQFDQPGIGDDECAMALDLIERIHRSEPELRRALEHICSRRRAELLEETPVSVTALGESAIRESTITRINQITQLVPNLQFDTAAGTFLHHRHDPDDPNRIFVAGKASPYKAHSQIFTWVDGTISRRIAMWDGAGWNALGGGEVQGAVVDLRGAADVLEQRVDVLDRSRAPGTIVTDAAGEAIVTMPANRLGPIGRFLRARR